MEYETEVMQLTGWTAVFTFSGRYTAVVLFEDALFGDPAKGLVLGGGAKCNPKDKYDREKGKREAMRRACGMLGGDIDLSERFHEFRLRQWEAKKEAERAAVLAEAPGILYGVDFSAVADAFQKMADAWRRARKAAQK